MTSEKTTALLSSALELHKKGDYAGAKESYQKVLAIDSEQHDALHLLGLIEIQNKNFVEGISLINKAISLHRDSAIYYSNLGFGLYEMGDFRKAISNFDVAIMMQPNYFDALYNCGNALVALGEHAGALSKYQQALTINPKSTAALYNAGIALQNLRCFKEALSYYDQALAIEPRYPEAIRNKALSLLYLGDYENGFSLFERRWQRHDFCMPQHTNGKPLLTRGLELSGKTVLLHSEQGLGDSIQFCRYATLLAQLGAAVMIEVERPLVKLLTTLNGVAAVFTKGDPLPHFDFHCPMLSLPFVFGTTSQTVPAAPRYLHSTEVSRDYWSKKLGAKTQIRIGIAWSGGQGYNADNTRSIKLSEFLQYLPAGFQYISLQKEVRPYDQETLESNPNVLHFGKEQNDFSDAAALIDNLDLVISVDTSIGHLSAALGKPTATMLSYLGDWRWIAGREDSPWYPTTKLFRQDHPNDWASAFAKLRIALFNNFYQSKRSLGEQQ